MIKLSNELHWGLTKKWLADFDALYIDFSSFMQFSHRSKTACDAAQKPNNCRKTLNTITVT